LLTYQRRRLLDRIRDCGRISEHAIRRGAPDQELRCASCYRGGGDVLTDLNPEKAKMLSNEVSSMANTCPIRA
jgi:hypothetical protein